jgi:hypothetical protein
MWVRSTMGDAQVYGICLEDSGDQPSNLGVQYPLLSFAETNSKGKGISLFSQVGKMAVFDNFDIVCFPSLRVFIEMG